MHGPTRYRFLKFVTPAGDEESLWNSREGTIPIGVPNYITGEMGDLVAYSKQYPDHIVKIGERIIVDATEVQRRVEICSLVEMTELDADKMRLVCMVYNSRVEFSDALYKEQCKIEGLARPAVVTVNSAIAQQLNGMEVTELFAAADGLASQVVFRSVDTEAIRETIDKRYSDQTDEAPASAVTREVTAKEKRRQEQQARQEQQERRAATVRALAERLRRGSKSKRATADKEPDLFAGIDRQFFGRDGKLISCEQWARLRVDVNYAGIAATQLPTRVISTVWLGRDQSGGIGRPQIFETMVFERQHPHETLASYRYATEEEAFRGHAKAVREWSSKTGDGNSDDN